MAKYKIGDIIKVYYDKYDYAYNSVYYINIIENVDKDYTGTCILDSYGRKNMDFAADTHTVDNAYEVELLGTIETHPEYLI